MGFDKVADHARADAEYIVSAVFARELGSDPNNDDVHYLANTSRSF